MPRYYFHVRRGQLTVIDQEGMELAGDIEAAQEAARRGRKIATNAAVTATMSSAARQRMVPSMIIDFDPGGAATAHPRRCYRSGLRRL